MRILNVNPYIDPVTGGGTAERTLQMSRFQAKLGHDVNILTLDVGIETGIPSVLDAVNVVTLRVINQRFLLSTIPWRDIQKLISSVDIIHLMGHWTVLNIIVYVLANKFKVPYVVCPAGSLPIFGRSRIIKSLYNQLWGKRIIQNADFCISVTEKEIADFLDYGVKREKIKIIPNGIDLENIPAPNPNEWGRLKLPERPFILFLGRLNLIKGPDILLKAYIRCTIGFDLVFVGPDGGMLEQLIEIRNEAGLANRVHFIGALKGPDKYQAYYAAHALIVPSRKEAMSIVAVESGITGTPVLLTDQCGFDEVEDIGGGIVVSASIEGVEKGLVSFDQNMDELPAIGERLKKYIINNLAWNKLVLQYDTLYESLLNLRV